MSEQKALEIKLVRECILSHITEMKDLLAVSLLNRDFYVDAKKRLESKLMGYVMTINQRVLEYTDQIKEPIICGRYVAIYYATEMKTYFQQKDKSKGSKEVKFTKALRAKVLKRLPLMEHRICNLAVIMGESMTAQELVALFKASRNALCINWTIDRYENEEKLSKILQEVKISIEADNSSILNAKTLKLSGGSEIVWKFWADEFMRYFPNIEALHIHNQYNFEYFIDFLRKLDDLGKLETLREFSCVNALTEEIWSRFLEKSYSFTELGLKVCEWNTPFLEAFLEKYQNQIENLRLNFSHGCDELCIPQMGNLKWLGLGLYSGDKSLGKPLVLIAQDEGAYPKLGEIQIEGFNLEKLMVNFRNISTNIEVSTRIQTVTASYFMDDDEFLVWKESGQEVGILEELNQLFPNANNKMYYNQMENPDYPNIKPDDNERNVKRCVIS